MGVKELMAAFNAEAAGRFVAAAAFLRYERLPDRGEVQILSFSGTDSTGAPFTVESDPLGARTDVNAAARTVAQKLINGG